MDEHGDWWDMHAPNYEEARAAKLIELMQREINAAQVQLGKLKIDEASLEASTQGYVYDDGVQLYVYHSDFVSDAIYDVVYELAGPLFIIALRQTLAKDTDDIEVPDPWWLDHADGDAAAVQWLAQPPRRAAMPVDA